MCLNYKRAKTKKKTKPLFLLGGLSVNAYAMSSFLLMVSATNWIKLSKTFDEVFLRTSLVIFLLNLSSLLCLQKDQGGLGFRLMKDVNFPIIPKLGWKLLTNHNSTWVTFFQQKYIKYGNLLSSPLCSGSWI